MKEIGPSSYLHFYEIHRPWKIVMSQHVLVKSMHVIEDYMIVTNHEPC